MKDEIKEIIDRLERIDHKEYIAFEFADSATFDEAARCFEERKKMANYITNLQEELKETADLCSKHFVKIQVLKEEIKDYKSRCEKAIEYIKEHIKYECDDTINGMSFYSYHLYNFKKEDLLNILSGGDDNE